MKKTIPSRNLLVSFYPQGFVVGWLSLRCLVFGAQSFSLQSFGNRQLKNEWKKTKDHLILLDVAWADVSFICDDVFQMRLRNGFRSELVILNSYSGSICQIGSLFS